MSNLEHCKILMVESVLYPVADGHFLPGGTWGHRIEDLAVTEGQELDLKVTATTAVFTQQLVDLLKACELEQAWGNCKKQWILEA